MHNNTFISLLLVCIALLSLVSAQDCGATGLGGNGASCDGGMCCSSSNFCGDDSAHCSSGCQPLFGTCTDGASDSPTSGATPTPAPSVSAPTASFTDTLSPSITMTTTTTTTTRTRATTTDDEITPSPTAKGTFQLQPTSKPSGATSSQDKGVKSTVALVVVFIAGLMMV